MQVYSALPKFEAMKELLATAIDDAKNSYDPVGISAYTLKCIEREYAPEEVAEIKDIIEANVLPIGVEMPKLDVRSFNYVHFPYDPEIPLPTRATARSAGYDFYLPEDIVVTEEGVKVWTGVSVHIPEQSQEFLAVYIRSSLSDRIYMANNVGIIDGDYEGNETTNGDIGLVLKAYPGKGPVELKRGDRIAQGIFQPYGITALDVPRSKIRTGGFGSTGKA